MEDVKTGDLIAVYGTLRGGRMPNTKFISKGTVKGSLVSLGGFPGFVPDPKGKDVVVEVYELSTPDLVTDHLDRYEGYQAATDTGMYLRRQMPVSFVVPEGQGDDHHADLANIRDAWIYVWNRGGEYPVIKSGDWFKRGAE